MNYADKNNRVKKDHPMQFAISMLKTEPARGSDAMKAVEWMVRQFRSLGPYLAVELILPGGSIIALLLWSYRHRTDRKGQTGMVTTLRSFWQRTTSLFRTSNIPSPPASLVPGCHCH